MMPKTRISKRGAGCPYCASRRVCKCSSLEAHHPELSSEWDFEMNGKTPSDVTSRSPQVVWWENNVREANMAARRLLHSDAYTYVYGMLRTESCDMLLSACDMLLSACDMLLSACVRVRRLLWSLTCDHTIGTIVSPSFVHVSCYMVTCAHVHACWRLMQAFLWLVPSVMLAGMYAD